MKSKLLLFALIAGTILTSCEKDEDEAVTPAQSSSTTNQSQNQNNNQNNNVQEVQNNTVHAGSNQESVSTAFITNLPDNNAGGEYYYSISLQESGEHLLAFMRQIPTSNTTLKYSTSTGATMELDEFNVNNVSVNGMKWYSVLTTSQDADIRVKVDADKITISFTDINLSDNFLQNNVTESRMCSASFSMKLSELQAVPKDGSSTINLID